MSENYKSEKSKITAVCSGTKGSGKTWLATTFSHSFGLLRKKTLLFDADCGLSNAGAQLGFSSYTPYLGLLSGSLTLNNAAFRYEKGHFDIICSQPGERSFAGAPIGRAQILARDLLFFSKFYDEVIIDCAGDELQPINILLNICDKIVLIANANPTSFAATYKKLVEIKALNCRAKIGIIINRVFSYEEGAQFFKSLLKAAHEYIKLDIELIGIIRQDSRIRDAILNQSLLLNRYPASEGAEDTVIASRRLEEFS